MRTARDVYLDLADVHNRIGVLLDRRARLERELREVGSRDPRRGGEVVRRERKGLHRAL